MDASGNMKHIHTYTPMHYITANLDKLGFANIRKSLKTTSMVYSYSEEEESTGDTTVIRLIDLLAKSKKRVMIMIT